ncbi:MAG: hypothetical protein R3332_12755 [Pseudohongiellaceae bacterium]|nr:hypothetical protein [Pseudohongiellaceae bacterium]
MSKALAIVLAGFFLSACAARELAPKQVSLDLLSAWYEGKLVYYISTDVSDPNFARAMNANFAPRLADAIPHYPKPPEQKTILERVYAFPNKEQANTVFASIPSPLGHMSEDFNYSPVWLMYTVNWVQPEHIVELRSEGDIFKAEAQGWVEITRTNIVVNCPIVSVDGETFLQAR